MKSLIHKSYFKWICISLIVLIILVVGYIILINKSAVKADSVSCFTIKTTDLYKSMNVSGEAVSDKVTDVFSDNTMRVKEVCFKVGDDVKAGDVICRFDTSEIEKQLANYKKMLEEFDEYNALMLDNYSDDVKFSNDYSKTALKELEVKIDDYQKNYDELKKSEKEYKGLYDEAVENCEKLKAKISSIEDSINSLKKIEAVTDNIADELVSLQKDKAKNEELYNLSEIESSFYLEKYKAYGENAEKVSEAIDQLKVQYELMKIEGEKSVSSAKNEKKYAELDKTIRNNYVEQIEILNKMLEKSEIKATVSGVISDLYAKPDNYIFDGKVCQIQDYGKLHFQAYVLPDYVEELSKNSKLILQFASNNYENVNGHITDIDNFYDEEKGGYKISFTTDESVDNYNIYPGFTVSVKIVIAERHDIIAVPYDSIAEDENGCYYVEKYDETTDTSERILVEKGLVTDYYVEIISDQLSEGDKIKNGLI
ncbi:MAG: HlyD family efflux transporter periplasmic adaptor subunit [Ruminococcus sp.]|nr:HlyD family efflux transporter periplasmic adaptor subunit [Ruminococcus sp.]